MKHSTIKAPICTSAYIVQYQFYSIHGPGGYEGAQLGKTFLHLLQWGKSLKIKKPLIEPKQFKFTCKAI
jgi:hypothetical protein